MQAYGLIPALYAAIPSAKAFSIGGTDVYWQGILLAAALIVALLLTGLEARRCRLPADTTVDLCLVMIPCGILGARIWYVLSNHALYAGDYLSMLRFWDGGLTIYGAILLATLGLFVYALKKKLRFYRLLDALTPGLLAALAIVLWGDFFAQTGFGPEVTNERQMWFPLAVLIERTDTIHYAAFFYEFLWCLLVLVFVRFFVRKRAKRDGSVFLWAMLLYCAGHAACTRLRIEPVAPAALTPVLLACAALAALLLIFQAKRPLPTDGPFAQAAPAPEPADEPVQGSLAEDGAAPGDPCPDQTACEESPPEADAETDREPSADYEPQRNE